MIALLIFFQLLPENESLIYETNDNGRMGTIQVTSTLDRYGYHVTYVSDRVIEVILDSMDLSTRHVRKIIDNDTVLEITSGSILTVYLKGREYRYDNEQAVYDRHTLDFALRGFDYVPGFKTMFRLHVPELTVVNAELAVLGEAVVQTPAGEFLCWEVAMKPRILFFSRRFFFYIEKEYPRRFIKYEDQSGGSSIILGRYEAGH
ncbi:hypothetical protein IBX73_06730 [candidate division WOR-3 bacterium]|nr:hypothetical protein [candidate division WOR-3 bacterium]